MSQHLSRHPTASGPPAKGLPCPLCLSFPPVCSIKACRQQCLGCLLAHGGGRGVQRRGACLRLFSIRVPAKTEQYFLIRNALWWEPLACPSWQQRGSRGSFILLIRQGLARPVSTLNLLEVRVNP